MVEVTDPITGITYSYHIDKRMLGVLELAKKAVMTRDKDMVFLVEQPMGETKLD